VRRGEFALELLAALSRRYVAWRGVRFATNGLAAEFNAASWLADRPVTMRHGAREIAGTFLGIDDDLRVRLASPGGELVLPGEQLERIDRGR
jgi:biotin-(acetyl-CoA carboxylase) ligase